MSPDAFRAHAHQLVDWMADYLRDVEQYPVKAQVKPGEILAQLPAHAPEHGEPFEAIFADFQNVILPGITHWQHPLFCAYFPANSSPPSVLAEMLTATLGAQCMLWETSPAAAELEERCLEWLRDLLGLPASFVGVIQDTASTATLAALLSARERATSYTANHTGLYDQPRFVVYSSQETHSSLDKAMRIAGLGSDNLRKLPVDDSFAVVPEALAEAITADRAQGLVPLCLVATLGTTSSTAVDPIAALAEIAQQENLWLHVDAAYAGSALILPELRHLIDGIEGVDSFVFNPHKWLLTNFDCSAYFVRDKAALIRTFEILPEYLKTGHASQVNNYRDWGVPLGRRFRALKLWFVLRSYGADGLRAKLRQHIAWAQAFRGWVEAHPDFEVLAPSPFGLVCFRFAPPDTSEDERERLNAAIKEGLNAKGELYLTHTKLKGAYTLRLVIGQTEITEAHVAKAWALIQAESEQVR